MTSISSVGTARIEPSLAGDELVADDLDRLDAALAEDLRPARRRKRSTQPACGLPAGSRAANSRRMLDVAPRARAVGLERGRARRVELEVGRIDDDVGAAELAELLQLGRRERRLRRAAAAEHRRSRLIAASRRSPRSTASVVSVGASSSRVSASIRATSIATLPLPITTARSCERSNSRCW